MNGILENKLRTFVLFDKNFFLFVNVDIVGFDNKFKKSSPCLKNF